MCKISRKTTIGLLHFFQRKSLFFSYLVPALLGSKVSKSTKKDATAFLTRPLLNFSSTCRIGDKAAWISAWAIDPILRAAANKMYWRPFQGIFGCAAAAWLWHTHSAMATKPVTRRKKNTAATANNPTSPLDSWMMCTLITLVYTPWEWIYTMGNGQKGIQTLSPLIVVCFCNWI